MVDAFHAMTSDRPYRSAMEEDDAVAQRERPPGLGSIRRWWRRSSKCCCAVAVRHAPLRAGHDEPIPERVSSTEQVLLSIMPHALPNGTRSIWFG